MQNIEEFYNLLNIKFIQLLLNYGFQPKAIQFIVLF